MSDKQIYDDFSDLIPSQDGLSIKYEEVNPFADVFSSLPSSSRRASESFPPAEFVDPHQDDHIQSSFSNLKLDAGEELPDSLGSFTANPLEETEKEAAFSPIAFNKEPELPAAVPFKDLSPVDTPFDSPLQKEAPSPQEAPIEPSIIPPQPKEYHSSPLSPQFKPSVREPTFNILDAQDDSFKSSPISQEVVKEKPVIQAPPPEPEARLDEVPLPEEEVVADLSKNSIDDDVARPSFDISVSEPQKVGDPISAYIVYKVKTHTTSPLFKSAELSVTRRYRDFLWLYNQLVNNHPGVIVPPVPEKHALGRFQDEFVETRRAALEKCLSKIAAHPRLNQDPDLVVFLSSDSLGTEIKERKSANSTGLMKAFGNAVSSATNFSKFVETDEWFENKRAQIEMLESQLKPLLKAFESYVKHRKELGGVHFEFAESIDHMASAEANPPLTDNLLSLSRLQHKIKELQDKQAMQDSLTLESTLDEYLRTIGSIKFAFTARVKSYQSWHHSIADFNKKRAQLEKLRSQSQTKQERLSQLTYETSEAESKVEEEKTKFEDTTSTLKQELVRFDEEKVEDFKASLEKYLRSIISTQMELISLWEAYLASTNEAQQELLDQREQQDSDAGSIKE
ncbi:Vps5-domain-containing protein [Basidiobolus meristosporus CBS 931.73]|uniref:Vps5-domain-containing protein n=1 Tax=Basidiobolus meristosporus CBS 931.73 TaxID=1314790 RepID=A0A1Y1YIF3_9FUNG|nr:Vps5-domain-containing protein [Basidiobolus meristosporus CBS 931.73]|eukprot:ORX97821.1 Vps5-domain-containing protein [Basidiobolus meristosporus CBS 931.73]